MRQWEIKMCFSKKNWKTVFGNNIEYEVLKIIHVSRGRSQRVGGPLTVLGHATELGWERYVVSRKVLSDQFFQLFIKFWKCFLKKIKRKNVFENKMKYVFVELNEDSISLRKKVGGARMFFGQATELGGKNYLCFSTKFKKPFLRIILNTRF